MSQISICWHPFYILNYICPYLPSAFSLVKTNAHFLRNTLLAFLIISVCQKFYDLHGMCEWRKTLYVGFRMFHLEGVFCKMSWACLTVWGAALAPSFKQAQVISTLRNRPLSETRKAYIVSFSLRTCRADSKSSCQTQNLSKKGVSRKWKRFP